MISQMLTAALMIVASSISFSQSPAETARAAHAAYERHYDAANRINELAAVIHSEADADAFITAIADVFAKELPPPWANSAIQRRIAHAEYETVHDSASLIPEKHIVDVWNQYVRAIGAPNEALVTVPEIHNMRDAESALADYMWTRGHHTVWTVPNIYTRGADGRVAEGCRAVEALRLVHDLEYSFSNLRGARERVGKGIVVSDEVKKHSDATTAQSHSVMSPHALAGFVTLLNHFLIFAGVQTKAGLGNINSNLYQLAQSSKYCRSVHRGRSLRRCESGCAC